MARHSTLPTRYDWWIWMYAWNASARTVVSNNLSSVILFGYFLSIVETKMVQWCISESELLASLQFRKEDGWLSAFYSCLIRKVLGLSKHMQWNNECIIVYASFADSLSSSF
jgi:hypothetical protein